MADRGPNPDTAAAPANEAFPSDPLLPVSIIDSSSEASTPHEPPTAPGSVPQPCRSSVDPPRRMPSLRSTSDPRPTSSMNPSSSVTGVLNTARRPTPSANNLPLELMQKTLALQHERSSRPPPVAAGPGGLNLGMAMPRGGPAGGPLMGGIPPNFKLPGGMARTMAPSFTHSAPNAPAAMKQETLMERRAKQRAAAAAGGSPSPGVTPKLSDLGADAGNQPSLNGEGQGSKLSAFGNYINAEKGWVTFEGAATITQTGVHFANGQTFSISLDEIEVLDELGKGNYGTVYKVKHARPKVPRFGQGLSQFKPSAAAASQPALVAGQPSEVAVSSSSNTSGKVMAMKEIRLELDEAKFTTILKELVILHECSSPYIIDFYGAFYQEGAVYMCIEYMDGGSIDKLYEGGISEGVLRKITYATIVGLKTLKDDHNIIHRDVKPTNILVNANGQVKICDFGVSGNLVASIAKTNIGCQSYMAPERISGIDPLAAGSADRTYNVQSDIWSLGLTVIECAMGRYPYPPEVSSTIFGQLNAIVTGEPPALPAHGFSAHAHDFVRSCLNKDPLARHTYPMLLAHPWVKGLAVPETIAEEETTPGDAADGEEEEEEVEKLARDVGGMLALGRQGQGCHRPPPMPMLLPMPKAVRGDREVAEWVRGVLARKGTGGGGGAGVRKPALHAAPLDSVASPGLPPSRGG
ncbi:kinase-like domain-containing protein [Staphylotrichum tortipilum]|uniref:mitogen-activated protein kinase kinase n=1 Tax=Staphylotrichum tortipilum TaxID=2831512 RepID=A0AAN6MML7_9PEZI|nr:kinase-like domain-containing protein [Staphylotrichum longicolle]